MFFCTEQALSEKPLYRAKMPSTATPVVHGNRPAARMLQNWMTALGGRGEAQSALLAYGGHETGQQLTAGFSLAPGTLSTGCLLKYLCLLSDKTESRGPARPERGLKKGLKY